MIEKGRLAELLDERGNIEPSPTKYLEIASKKENLLPATYAPYKTNDGRWSIPIPRPVFSISQEVREAITKALQKDSKRPPQFATEFRENFSEQILGVVNDGRIGRSTWIKLVDAIRSDNDLPIYATQDLYSNWTLHRDIIPTQWNFHINVESASGTSLASIPNKAHLLNTSMKEWGAYEDLRFVISSCPGDFMRLGHRAIDEGSCFRVGGENQHHPLILAATHNTFVGFLKDQNRIIARILLYRDIEDGWLFTNFYPTYLKNLFPCLFAIADIERDFNVIYQTIRDDAHDLLQIYCNEGGCILTTVDRQLHLWGTPMRTPVNYEEQEEYEYTCESCGTEFNGDDMDWQWVEGVCYCESCVDEYALWSECENRYLYYSHATELFDGDYAHNNNVISLSGEHEGEYAHEDDPTIISHRGHYYFEGDPALTEEEEEEAEC